jgi:hypothetical protein
MTTTLSHDHEPAEPKGEYVLRVDKVTQDDDRLVWSFIVDQGKYPEWAMEYLTSLAPQSLWSCAIFSRSWESKSQMVRWTSIWINSSA